VDPKQGKTSCHTIYPFSNILPHILISIHSVRTWKSKLKEWNYEKYLTSNDMNIISAKAKKRKNEDGKETVFYHWDSEISFERIERFRKAPKTSGMASPGAGE